MQYAIYPNQHIHFQRKRRYSLRHLLRDISISLLMILPHAMML